MKTQESYRQQLNRLVNAFPRSISYPYGQQVMGYKPVDVWQFVGKNH